MQLWHPGNIRRRAAGLYTAAGQPQRALPARKLHSPQSAKLCSACPPNSTAPAHQTPQCPRTKLQGAGCGARAGVGGLCQLRGVVHWERSCAGVATHDMARRDGCWVGMGGEAADGVRVMHLQATMGAVGVGAYVMGHPGAGQHGGHGVHVKGGKGWCVHVCVCVCVCTRACACVRFTHTF